MGYAVVRKVLGDGLLFQDGAVHARNRKLMMPAFTSAPCNPIST
jgi:cytochrome P450